MSGKIITRVRERQRRADVLRRADEPRRGGGVQLVKFDPATRLETPYAIRPCKPVRNYAADPITRFFAKLFRL